MGVVVTIDCRRASAAALAKRPRDFCLCMNGQLCGDLKQGEIVRALSQEILTLLSWDLKRIENQCSFELHQLTLDSLLWESAPPKYSP
jgi:hypothetical protein